MKRPLLAVWSATLFAGCAGPPPPPAGLRASGADRRVLLSWGRSPGASTYQVLRGEAAGGPWAQIWSGDGLSAADEGLPAAAVRWYAVAAFGDGGASAPSPAVRAVTAPAAPANLQATASAASVALQWDPVPLALAYQVQRSVAGGAWHFLGAPVAETGLVDAAVEPGVSYSWQVMAVGEGGLGAPSQAARGQVAPQAASQVTAAAGGGVVVLRWAPSAGATGYAISRAAGTAPLAQVAATAATSWADLAPPAGPLRYLVEPLNPAGKGGGASAQVAGGDDPPVVVVRSQLTWVSDAGEQVLPEDMTRDQWAIVQQSADGGWSRYPGVPSANGVVLFLGVQAGGYLLQRIDPVWYAPDWLVASGGALDLSRTVLGRPDATPVANTRTGFSLSVSGLVPWTGTEAGDGDWLELFSAGTWSDQISYGPVAAGASSAEGVPITFDPLYDFVIDASAGDVTWVSQGVSKTTPDGFPYSAAERFWSGAASGRNGGLAPVSAALQPTPEHSGSLTLRGSVLDGFLGEVGPLDRPYYWQTVTQTLQPAPSHGSFSAGPSLLWANEAQFVPGLQSSDRTVGPLAWGDPYPASWGRVGYYQVVYRTMPQAPGAAQPARFFAMLELRDGWDAFAAAPLEPRISPPRAVTVGGQPAGVAGPIAGVGSAPLIAWDPPRLGRPTSYQVHLRRLDVSGGATVVKPVATVRTTSTRVQLPPGTFAPGAAYLVVVRAVDLDGQDLAAQPNGSAIRLAAASAVSGVLLP